MTHEIEMTPKEILQAQMKQAELYALWWIAAASNGTAAQRMISVADEDNGGKKRYLTKEELIKDAMDTAKRHIERFNSLSGI